ncbi:MAG: trypsin-like peptidase domain-containing protein [Planctomycetales bacterium]
MAESDPQHSAHHRRSSVWVWLLAINALVLAALTGVGWHFVQSARRAAEERQDRIPTAPELTSPSPPASSEKPIRESSAQGEMPLTVEEIVKSIEGGVVFLTTFDSQGNRLAFGSGFVIDTRGLVATNLHVLRGASTATAEFSDRHSIGIKGLRAWDVFGDLAILELESVPDNLTVLKAARNSDYRSGMEVVALGHPQEFKFTTTTGVLSAVHKSSELPPNFRQFISANTDNTWLQTTAAIAGGSSGSPLLNRNGEVIGINTWTAGAFGFAIDVRHLHQLRSQLRDEAASLAAITGPQEQRLHLTQGYIKKMGWLTRELEEVKSEGEQRAIVNQRHPALEYVPRLCELAERHPQSPAAFESLATVCQILLDTEPPKDGWPEFERAARHLEAEFINDRRLINIMWTARLSSSPEVSRFLRAVAEGSSDASIRGTAWHCLGCSLAYGSQSIESADAAIAALQHVVQDYPDSVYYCSDPEHPFHRLGPEAEDLQYRLGQLAVGRQAPEITGRGQDGSEMRLSDYRGKVVLIDFWVSWCPPCQKMLEHNRALVAALKDRPFALLGVFMDDEPELSPLVAKNAVTWPNWVDGPEGSIGPQYRISVFPTVFIVDHKGAIRHHLIGGLDGDELRKRIDELLKEIPEP